MKTLYWHYHNSMFKLKIDLVVVLFIMIALLTALACPSPGLAAHRTSRAHHGSRTLAIAANATCVPVITPDLPKLPWTLRNGVKVFHLTAEIVKREILPASPMAPAKVITVWGYNGVVPGPTIEVNEGDHVQIVFRNRLPEDTTVH